MSGAPRPGVDLYWIPLGAGARVVRLSGAVYEALTARLAGRERRAIFHAALIARTGDGAFSIEMTPIPDDDGRIQRGVVGEGPVGARWAGRLRVFRYEIRCWRDGVIPDLQFAVGSPVLVSGEGADAQRLVDLAPLVPRPTWGRDELGAGDMWNSNSVVAWLLANAGLAEAAGAPPNRGRAPGWDAGIFAAAGTGPAANHPRWPQSTGAGATEAGFSQSGPADKMVTGNRTGTTT